MTRCIDADVYRKDMEYKYMVVWVLYNRISMSSEYSG